MYMSGSIAMPVIIVKYNVPLVSEHLILMIASSVDRLKSYHKYPEFPTGYVCGGNTFISDPQ